MVRTTIPFLYPRMKKYTSSKRTAPVTERKTPIGTLPTLYIHRYRTIAPSQKQIWEKMCIITYRMTLDVAREVPT